MVRGGWGGWLGGNLVGGGKGGGGGVGLGSMLYMEVMVGLVVSRDVCGY